MKETKSLRKLREKMQFPGIRKILVKYYDESEEPVIAKKDLYKDFIKWIFISNIKINISSCLHNAYNCRHSDISEKDVRET